MIGEIQDYFSAISRDDSIGEGAVELVDLSRVRYFNVDFKDASAMPKNCEPVHATKGIRGTILNGSNSIYAGLAELIRFFFKSALPHHPFEVVGSESDARAEAKRILSGGEPGASF